MSDKRTIKLTSDYARERAKHLVDRAPHGFVVTFDQEKRSSEANAKMWAMLSDIARAKPMGRVLPVEVWKALFMAEAGFKPRFEPSLDGNGVVPVGYKSSRLTKAEFSELIECIAAFGAEHGVVWSDPAERKAA